MISQNEILCDTCTMHVDRVLSNLLEIVYRRRTKCADTFLTCDLEEHETNREEENRGRSRARQY